MDVPPPSQMSALQGYAKKIIAVTQVKQLNKITQYLKPLKKRIRGRIIAKTRDEKTINECSFERIW